MGRCRGDIEGRHPHAAGEHGRAHGRSNPNPNPDPNPNPNPHPHPHPTLTLILTLTLTQMYSDPMMYPGMLQPRYGQLPSPMPYPDYEQEYGMF